MILFLISYKVIITQAFLTLGYIWKYLMRRIFFKIKLFVFQQVDESSEQILKPLEVWITDLQFSCFLDWIASKNACSM